MATSPAAVKLANNVIDVFDGDDEIFGDQFSIGGTLIGGDDLIRGANNAECGYLAYGDAYCLEGNAKGGNDKLVGGSYSGWYNEVALMGDSENMWDSAIGGNDSITGGINSWFHAHGDAFGTMGGQTKGGADTIRGGNATDGYFNNDYWNDITGDGTEMECNAIGGNDSLMGGNVVPTSVGCELGLENYIDGDGDDMEDSSVGGADRLFGGSATAYASGDADIWVENWINGDGEEMEDCSRGGADFIQGGNLVAVAASADAEVLNVLSGDAGYMECDAAGGNDTLLGGGVTGVTGACYGGEVENYMAGDAMELDGASMLGNDKLTGGSVAAGLEGSVFNVMSGDVLDASQFLCYGFGDQAFIESDFGSGDYDTLVYGNDTLEGGHGAVENWLMGDAYELDCGEVGGNDRLVAGKTNGDGEGDLPYFDFCYENLLIGDAYYMDWGSQGGKDTLISGTGNDVMAGDAVYGDKGVEGGADRFIFAPSNGEDLILDFDATEGDRIDLYALRANAQLRSYQAMLNANRLEQDGSDVIVHLDSSAGSDNNTVTLMGVQVADLASAFIFTAV